MVPFEFGETKKNVAEEARAKFQDKSIWVLSKAVFDKTQAQWIGSPKKLAVPLKSVAAVRVKIATRQPCFT